MREAIVVLSPDKGSKKNVQRSHLGPPFYFETFFDPFAMLDEKDVLAESIFHPTRARIQSFYIFQTHLVYHGVNYMNERLIAI